MSAWCSISARICVRCGERWSLVSNYRPELPEWVRKSTPRCILALGLTMPCTADDVLAAYRRKVKQLHPDLGGDRREFLRLQAHFEQAMEFLEEK